MQDAQSKNRGSQRWLIIGVIYCLVLAGLLFWIGKLTPISSTKIEAISIDPTDGNLIIEGENISKNISAVLTTNLQTPQTIISNNSTWQHVRDIAMQGHNAWMANSSSGVLCYDLQDPAHPILKSVLQLKAITWRLAIADNKLFVAAGKSGLFIIDISKPSAPAVISTHPDYIVSDVEVKDNIAILATAKHGLVFIDISDIDKPQQITSSKVIGNLQAVTIHNNHVYSVGKSDRQGILHVFNISDRLHPQHVATVELPQTGWACTVLGNQLMIALGANGVYSCDISTPEKRPQPVKTVINHNAFDLCIIDNKLYVTSLSDHLYQYTADHGVFKKVQTILLPSDCRQVSTYNNLIIAATRKDGFVIIDPARTSQETPVNIKLSGIQYRKAKILTHGNTICISSYNVIFLLKAAPDGAITLLDSMQFALPIRTFTLDAKRVYVALSNKQIHILNLQQDPPLQTELIGKYQQIVNNFDAYNNTLYTSFSKQGITAIDIDSSDTHNCMETEIIPSINSASIRQDSLIYVAAIPNCLQIYKVEHGHQAKLIGTLDYSTPLQTRAPASQLALVGKYLFVTNGENGILSIDISNARKPKLVDSIDLGGFCNDIIAQGDIACVSINNKIEIVNISNPKHLQQLCELPATRSVAIMGDKLLQLTDQGITVLPIPQPLPIICQHSHATKFQLPSSSTGDFDLQIATKDGLLRYSDILTVNELGEWKITRALSAHSPELVPYE
ncbi:MAG: hypothetical protein RBR22_08480 [Desulfuromonas sp.]|nr:hypothetical protein [Desulfuromonas sp.]